MTLKGLGAIDDAGAGVASITESYLWFFSLFFESVKFYRLI
jgi:hypothetical protein